MPDTTLRPASRAPGLHRRVWLLGGGALGTLAACPWLAACGNSGEPVWLSVVAQVQALSLAAGERGRVQVNVQLHGPYQFTAVELVATSTSASVTLGFEPDRANPYQVNANDSATAVLLVDVAPNAASGTARINVFGNGPHGTAVQDEIELTITAAGVPTGTRWEALPSAGVPSTRSTSLIGVAADTAGRPVLAAFHDGARGRQVLLRRFDGAAWADLLAGADNAGPPPVNAGALLLDAAFALDASDRPLFVRVDRASGDTLSVWRHEGGAWQPLGGALNMRPGAASTISRIAMVLDSAGNPVLLFNENRAGSSVDYSAYLKRWNAGAWQLLPGDKADGAIETGAPGINDLALALDDHDAPQVVLSAYSGTRKLRHWAWGAGWFSNREVNPPGSDAVFARIAVDRDGAALIAWVQTRPGANDLFVTRIDVHGNTSLVRDPALGRDTLNFEAGSTVLWPALRRDRLGRIVVVWGERAPGGGLDDIRARRLDGTAWQLLGGAVYTLVPPARNPQLCFDTQAEPVVAWEQSVDLGGSGTELGLAQWVP